MIVISAVGKFCLEKCSILKLIILRAEQNATFTSCIQEKLLFVDKKKSDKSTDGKYWFIAVFKGKLYYYSWVKFELIINTFKQTEKWKDKDPTEYISAISITFFPMYV